ncbi:MAG: LysR family transcriptional regulator [Cyanobacteria bacterium J06626_6]
MVGKPAKYLRDKIKLSQLRALSAVVTTGSFSEAALQLNVSQSTVSHSIAALEEALGITLIHRGRNGASLTPVGDRIFSQAQRTIALIEEMGHEATRAKGIDGGLVRIAAYRSMASEILPEVIAELHKQHPTVQVSITEFDSNRELVIALQEGKADFAIAEILKGPQFSNVFLMEDPFVALLPPSFQASSDISFQASEAQSLEAQSLEAQSLEAQLLESSELHSTTALNWQDLRAHPLITSSSDCCKIIMPLLQQVRPPIEIDYFISNDSTAVSMTRQGLGIAILPKLAAQPIPADVQVAQLPFHIARPLGISWLENSLLTPAAYAFLDAFKRSN